MKFLAVIDLGVIIDKPEAQEAYAAFLRDDIDGVELANRLGCSVEDAQRGISGLLTVSKLRVKTKAGRVAGSVRELREGGDWQWTLEDLRNDIHPRDLLAGVGL